MHRQRGLLLRYYQKNKTCVYLAYKNNFIIFLVFWETAKYNLFSNFDRNPSCPATAIWPLFILFSQKFRLTFPSRNFSDLVENYMQGKHILKHFKRQKCTALFSNLSWIRFEGSRFKSRRHHLLFSKRSVQTGDEMPGMKIGPANRT